MKITRNQFFGYLGLTAFIVFYGFLIMNRGNNDYRVFELAATRLLKFEAITIYENFAFSYPPLFAVIMLPITTLPTLVGAWIFYLVSVYLLFVSIMYFIKTIKLILPEFDIAFRNSKWLIFLAFFLTSRYIFNVLEHLQFDMLTLFGLVMAFYCIVRKKIVFAGFFLAFAISLKVTPLLLIVYFLWKKQWKLIGYTSLFLILLNLIPELFFGLHRGVSYNWEWVEVVVLKLDSSHLTSDQISIIWPPNSIMNQAIKPWIYRLFVDNSIGIGGSDYFPNFLSLTPKFASLFSAILSAVLLGIAGYIFWIKRSVKTLTHYFSEIAIILILMLLISPVSSKSHFITLIYAHLIILLHLSKSPSRNPVFFFSSFCVILGFLPPLFGSTVDQWCQMYGFTTLHTLLLFFLLGYQMMKYSKVVPEKSFVSQ